MTETQYFEQFVGDTADNAPLAYAVGDTVTYTAILGNVRTVTVNWRGGDAFTGRDTDGLHGFGYDSDILSVTPAATDKRS